MLNSRVPCADDEQPPARGLVDYGTTPSPQRAAVAATATPDAGQKPAVPSESPAAVTQVGHCVMPRHC